MTASIVLRTLWSALIRATFVVLAWLLTAFAIPLQFFYVAVNSVAQACTGFATRGP